MSSTASASTQYTLAIGNGGMGVPGPFGTVDVTRTSTTTATVTWTGLDSSGGQHFLFGDGGSLALNLSSALTGYSVVGTPSQPQTPVNGFQIVSTTSGNEDGFGNFNTQWNFFDGFGYSVRSITLNITASGANWLTDSDVTTTLNGDGYRVAGHIFTANANYTDRGTTGYAVNGTPAVPEPSSMAIAGLGALGFVAYGLRRRMKK